MCYPRGEFLLSEADIHLGEIGGQPFFIGAQQYAYWEHTHLIIDVTPGRGSGFSLEAPLGLRFLTRSRLYEDPEWATLQAEGGPMDGAQWLALQRD